MPSFDQIFADAKGTPVYYKGTEIKRIDRFPVKNNDILVCSIEEAFKRPGYLQGFCIDVTGHCELDGVVHKKGKGIRLLFWDGCAPKQIKLKVFTKLDHVIVYNICEVDTSYLINDENGNPVTKHSKCLDSKYNGAAMLVEEIENGRRYRCSDTNGAEKPFPFNDIVFTVQKPKE